MDQVSVVHEGRGGYVEITGVRYPIELHAGGHFSIHFPNGNRGTDVGQHLKLLRAFASEQCPVWAIENSSKIHQ